MSDARVLWQHARLAQAGSTGAATARPPNAFDLRLSALYGSLAMRLPWRLRRARRVAALALAHGPVFEAMDDAALRASARQVREALLRLGPSPARAAESLALFREAARRVHGLNAFPVQLVGAAALLDGALAEMATGEGKTLTAVLAAGCAALGGIVVHVVTVNDYLAGRDAEFARPVLGFFGLSVGATAQQQPPAQRREAYSCDVTYCTNKDVVFDHLRDRLAGGLQPSPRLDRLRSLLGGSSAGARLQRGLAFAIVDEADSVLVDEARTPLIISSEREAADFRLYERALWIARGLEDQDYVVDDVARQVQLTERGRAAAAAACRDAGGLWRSERAREQLVCQALSALHLFTRDRDYIVRDGKVQIVDEYTGRVLADRSWERGTHQLVEAKEGVDMTAPREAMARITYQRFFRRYAMLAGMSGTAREVAGELWAVYGLRVVSIPTHRPSRRRHGGRLVYTDADERWQALVDRCRDLQAAGCAVLVGTRSVQTSEAVASRLAEAGLLCTVLNARQDADEARIVAQAGAGRRITVATNMAGRGTDIALSDDVRRAGGLHVILTEFHEARRIDRQLYGRCARQGDPGSVEAIAFIGDDLFARFGAPLRRWASRLHGKQLPRLAAACLIAWSQWRAQRAHARVRLQTLLQDFRFERMTGFTGRKE